MITLAFLLEQFWTMVQGGRSQAEHGGVAELRRHRFESRETEVTISYGVELQKGEMPAGKQSSGNLHRGSIGSL